MRSNNAFSLQQSLGVHLMKPKNLLFSLILLIVGLVAILNTTTPDVNASDDQSTEHEWLTFTESSFGYQIEYPSDWYPTLVADNTLRAEQYGENVSLRSIGFFGPNSQMVFVDVWHNPSGLSLSEWMQKHSYPVGKDNGLILSVKETKVSGQNSIETIGEPVSDQSGLPAHHRFQFAKDDLIFSIEYNGLELNPVVFEHMVNTFQFVPATKSRTASSILSDTPPPASYGIQVASCCGITDPEYNPFRCNSAEGSGNCTWWARYSRRGNNEANLYHCTMHANGWDECAETYYPHLLSDTPQEKSVIVWTWSSDQHVTYIESMNSNSNYRVSQMGWTQSCPQSYYNQSHSSRFKYIHHPDLHQPNQPPNPPPLVSPANGVWLNSRALTLSWQDGGDPDNGPRDYRDYYGEIWNSGWSATYGWATNTSWQLNVPGDGVFSWHIKAGDGADGSAWSETRIINVDATAPNPPSVSISGANCNGIANNVWQNQCYAPTFNWSANDGSGSGIKEYRYCGSSTNANCVPEIQTNNTSYTPSPIAPAGGTGDYYFKVNARDNVNLDSSPTLFAVRYDAAAPTVSVEINNGSAATNQINVTINPTASDVGSGVEQVRVSNNGVEWSAWQTYQAGMSIPWVLPSLNRQEHTVYAQVKDKAGNFSTTASDTIVLELYPLAPHSTNYRLCANVVNVAGQAGLGSTTYRLTSNIGEAWIGAAISAGYQGKSGLLADLDNCRPIEYVAGEEFILTHSVIASGGSLRGNANYLLGDTVGETAASSKNAFSSNNYQLTSGFWSDVQVGSGALPPPPPTPIPVTLTPTPAPGPTSTPVPTTFSVSIGNGVQFTNNPNVTVRLTAPNVNQVRLSNDGGYAEDNWQPYQTSLNWTIDTYGSYVLPRFVYAWFKDADGIVYGTYFDDIIYDPIAPTGTH
jgi:hypothetical protein